MKILMIKNFISLLCKLILSVILNKKKIILFTGTDFNSFNENSKYLYLYLSRFKKYTPVWITTNEEIFDYLKKRNLDVIYKKGLLSIIYYLGSDVLVGTGESFPIKKFFLSNNCIKLNLRHGYGPRSNGLSFKIENEKISIIHDNGESYRLNLSEWDYINYTNKNISKVLGKKFNVSNKKRVIFGFPRCYQYSDEKINDIRSKHKKYLNELGFDINKKFLLYAPTWRLNNKNLPIISLKGFSFDKFNKFLKSKNYFFLINTHYHTKIKIKNYSNIFFLKKNFLFDINTLLPEIDLLITDYSSIATDFLLLKKKIIHVLPDHDEYIKNIKLLTDLDQINSGPIIKDYKNLIKNLNNMKFIKNKKIKKYIKEYVQSKKMNYSLIDKFINKII